MWWQELLIYQIYSYVASEVSNEIKLYAVSDQVKSYVVSATSSDTIYLQEMSSEIWRDTIFFAVSVKDC